MVRRQAQWKKYQSRLDPTRLVFIDETWAKTNMTRTHGRSRRGARLVVHAPQGRWRTLTFLAALRCDRIDAPCVIDGPINGQSFLAYVEQIPVPTLRPGDIVILDNLGTATSAQPAAERMSRRRLHLRWADRALFIWLYRRSARHECTDCTRPIERVGDIIAQLIL